MYCSWDTPLSGLGEQSAPHPAAESGHVWVLLWQLLLCPPDPYPGIEDGNRIGAGMWTWSQYGMLQSATLCVEPLPSQLLFSWNTDAFIQAVEGSILEYNTELYGNCWHQTQVPWWTTHSMFLSISIFCFSPDFSLASMIWCAKIATQNHHCKLSPQPASWTPLSMLHVSVWSQPH